MAKIVKVSKTKSRIERFKEYLDFLENKYVTERIQTLFRYTGNIGVPSYPLGSFLTSNNGNAALAAVDLIGSMGLATSIISEKLSDSPLFPDALGGNAGLYLARAAVFGTGFAFVERYRASQKNVNKPNPETYIDPHVRP